jgi:hypothetical protein
MQFPIVQEYKTDTRRTNPENEITDEPFKVDAGVFTRVIVARHAPFFVESLRMKFPNGEPMILDEDYEIFKIMPRLTELVAQPVACMITLKKPEITGGTISYHVVGEFPLLDSTMLGLIVDCINDDRPVYWENLRDKPSVFPPTLHAHSVLYDIVAFQDTIEFLGDMQALIARNGMDIIERRLTHFMELVDWYIGVYGRMLDLFLKNHAESYDAHGLKANDVALEKVDNFSTATFADVLQGRDDMHLRPQELKTIIEHYGFNADEFLEAKTMPIAQFGNTNFIPPNIDGSFEGFGGVIETGAMCLENDNSITVLWNRMDGRTRGLYYSVLTDPDAPNALLTYTGFKYEHPRFDPDNANVDRIAQGSGDECILVGDSFKDIFYVGVTNGSLDPAKHVYSKINLRPLVDAIQYNPGAHTVSELFNMVSVAMMGDWVYIFLSASVAAPVQGLDPDLYSNLSFKHIFRVPIASIKAQVDVVATRQNVSFMDADGVQWNNSPYFSWYTTVRDGSGNVTKGYHTFSPYPSNGFLGCYRSCLTLVAQNPNNPASYAVKFLAGQYTSYVSPTVNSAFWNTLEINYDFNPVTGVFTLKSRTAPFNVNFGASADNLIPVPYRQSIFMYYLVFFYQAQGANILDDGRLISAGAFGFTGFPRATISMSFPTAKTRFATVNKFFGNMQDVVSPKSILAETLTAPTESGINPRGMLYNPGGEYYVAAHRSVATSLKMYWKTVSGKFAVRSEIQNLFMSNIVSRPLTNNIRRVNANAGLGGATVVVPSAKLDTYGVDVGESQFCVNSQKSSFNRELIGNAWPGGVAAGDIVLVQQHTQRIETDGTITIVPTLEILYPAYIVESIKAQVEVPAIMNRGRARHVTVCDPTFSNLTAKFGWLPVTCSVQYTDADGTPDQFTLFTTIMTLQPTYAVSGGRYVVTGFTVINIAHHRAPSCGVNILRVYNSGDYETPQSTMGPMRIQYYLNGSVLSVLHGCGVMAQTPGDQFTRDFLLTYNNRDASHAWSGLNVMDHSSRGGGWIMTPDNGIQVMRGWDLSTGGAATISEGLVNYPLIGSVYPEVGWIIFFKTDINVVFYGTLYVLPLGSIDLRDIDPAPQWKTFYIYAILDKGVPRYDIAKEKRLETNYQLWVGTVITNDRQILTIERYNVFALDGHRITETKRGNSIPAASGLANAEGQIPWLRAGELLP